MYKMEAEEAASEHKTTERSRFVDIAQGERAEVELDAFIERRSRKNPDADEREELWKASVAAYNARREEEVRFARVEYHQGQAVRLRTALEALITHHETQAERLCEEGVA